MLLSLSKNEINSFIDKTALFREHISVLTQSQG